MKKLLLVLMFVLSCTLIGCNNTDELESRVAALEAEPQIKTCWNDEYLCFYDGEVWVTLGLNNATYNKSEIDQFLFDMKEEFELEPLQDYILTVLFQAMLDFDSQFAEINDTVSGTVEAYGWGYVIIYVEEPTKLGITFVDVPEELLDVEIYVNNNFMDADYIVDELTSGYQIIVEATEGYVTIELESWDEVNDLPYTITIEEIGGE